MNLDDVIPNPTCRMCHGRAGRALAGRPLAGLRLTDLGEDGGLRHAVSERGIDPRRLARRRERATLGAQRPGAVLPEWKPAHGGGRRPRNHVRGRHAAGALFARGLPQRAETGSNTTWRQATAAS
jgi:hypothetical protein